MPAASHQSDYSSSSQESLAAGVDTSHWEWPEDHKLHTMTSDERWQQFRDLHALPSIGNPNMFDKYFQTPSCANSSPGSQGSQTQKYSHKDDKQPQPQTSGPGAPTAITKKRKCSNPRTTPRRSARCPWPLGPHKLAWRPQRGRQSGHARCGHEAEVAISRARALQDNRQTKVLAFKGSRRARLTKSSLLLEATIDPSKPARPTDTRETSRIEPLHQSRSVSS